LHLRDADRRAAEALVRCVRQAPSWLGNIEPQEVRDLRQSVQLGSPVGQGEEVVRRLRRSAAGGCAPWYACVRDVPAPGPPNVGSIGGGQDALVPGLRVAAQ